MTKFKIKKKVLLFFAGLLLVLNLSLAFATPKAFAAEENCGPDQSQPCDTTPPCGTNEPGSQPCYEAPNPKVHDVCGGKISDTDKSDLSKGGDKSHAVEIGFNIGCNQAFENAILDVAFAIMRFLSYGVGLVVVIFVIYGGIQYSTTQGNPQKAMETIGRIRSALTALVIYILLFAIANWLIPGGMF